MTWFCKWNKIEWNEGMKFKKQKDKWLVGEKYVIWKNGFV